MSEKPVVQIALDVEDAKQLFDLISHRPYTEAWSGRVYEALGLALGRDVPAHVANGGPIR